MSSRLSRYNIDINVTNDLERGLGGELIAKNPFADEMCHKF